MSYVLAERRVPCCDTLVRCWCPRPTPDWEPPSHVLRYGWTPSKRPYHQVGRHGVMGHVRFADIARMLDMPAMLRRPFPCTMTAVEMPDVRFDHCACGNHHAVPLRDSHWTVAVHLAGLLSDEMPPLLTQVRIYRPDVIGHIGDGVMAHIRETVRPDSMSLPQGRLALAGASPFQLSEASMKVRARIRVDHWRRLQR